MVGGRWGGEKKTKIMLYSTLVEVEVEVGVELGNNNVYYRVYIKMSHLFCLVLVGGY